MGSKYNFVQYMVYIEVSGSAVEVLKCVCLWQGIEYEVDHSRGSTNESRWRKRKKVVEWIAMEPFVCIEAPMPINRSIYRIFCSSLRYVGLIIGSTST